MQREFLKNLGIEDKDIISRILDENSADIGKAKGELQSYKDKVSDLESQLSAREKEIGELRTTAERVEALTGEITQLKTEKATLATELETKVTEIKRDHAIEGAIRDAKGKNIKAIRALLDMDKITYENGELGGLSDQLTALAGAEDSSMLFGEVKPAPAGTHPNNPPSVGGNPPTSTSLSEAVHKAIGKATNK